MKRPRSSNQTERLYRNYAPHNYENLISFPHNKYSSYIQHRNNSQGKTIKNYLDNKEDIIDEQLIFLNEIWDRLGITSEYRINFLNYIKHMSNPKKIDIILQEKNNLKNLEDYLLNLKKEIINRENNLESLRKYNNSLENINNREELISDILEEVINVIKKVRKDAINIFAIMINLKNILNKYLNHQEIDISKIKQNFSYDPNYLNKMDKDLFFLKDSSISKYIEVNNYKIDPFLINCVPNRNKINYTKKINIPIPEEQIKLIKELKYALSQEEKTNYPNNIDSFRINKYFEDNINVKKNDNKDYYEANYLNDNKSLYRINSIKTGNKNFNEKEANISQRTYELNNSNGKINYPINYYCNPYKIETNSKNIYIKLKKKLLLSKNNKKDKEEIKRKINNDYNYKFNELNIENIDNKIIKITGEDPLKNRFYKNYKKNLAKNEEQKNINIGKSVDNMEMELNRISKISQENQEILNKIDIKKNKGKGLNNLIQDYEKEKKGKDENKLIERIKTLEKKLKNEENLRKKREKEIDELKIKNNENNNLNKNLEIYEKQMKNFEEEKKKMIIEIKNKENEINKINEENIQLSNKKAEIEKNYIILKNEKENLENKYNTLNNENKILKDKIVELEKIAINKNPYSIDIFTGNYKINYYKGKLPNLINLIKDKIILKKIPDFLIRALSLNNSIFTEDFYCEGIFPKIIISTEDKDENNVKGLCSIYYESNENLDNLILRINAIYAIEDYENQIIKMINFIINNMKFKRLEIYLLYDKLENKFIQNQEAKNLFQKKIGFKWLCVVRDEKNNQRYIRLYLEGNENQKNIENPQKMPNNNFNLDNLSIISINNEDNSFLLKDIIKNESEKKDNNGSDKNKIFKDNCNKYINPNPIYSLIYENPLINKKNIDSTKLKELKELKEKLWRFVIPESGWNIKEEDKKKIKDVEFYIENSAYKKVEKIYNENNIEILCDLYKNNISINFENNYSILINDIYYNKITSDKIKILKETKTESLFFLIPSNDNTVLFYVSEINQKLRELLIDNDENVYEKFLEFQPSSQNEINEVLSSDREITYLPQSLKTSSKTIYIPTFSIDIHLSSYNYNVIEKKINITEIETNKNLKVTSVDEYINVNFLPEENIENSFKIIPNKNKCNNIIIENSFIVGIFDNDIINNNKLPLLHFLYITKDHFLVKNKYNSTLKIEIK